MRAAFFAAILFVAPSVFAAPLPVVGVLSNELVRLDFDAAGFVVQFLEFESGRHLAYARSPFVVAECVGKTLEPVSFELTGGEATWRFEGDGAVVLGVTPFEGGWTFEVRQADIPGVRRLRVGCLAGVACNKYASETAQCVSDRLSGIVLRGYEYDSHGRYGVRTELTLEADRPLVGRRFGFVAGPRPALVPALKAMTLQSGFPHSTAGGAWSTGSEQCRGSYLNGRMTAANVGDFIAVALLGGFDVVHFRENWYERRGHYRVNTNDFPRGLADLKEAVAQVHAAGLRAGLHTLTGCIDPQDEWVTPVCTSNLMNWATYTLAAPLGDGATELVVAEEPIATHDAVYTYSGNGNVLRLGGELIQYSGIRREGPFAFTGLVRGAFGTHVTPHRRGETVAYLQQRYLAFYPDPDSPLAVELAETIGNVYRTCGFDQIYLDGTEGMMTDYAMAKMRALIYGACVRDGRPCLVEDSHGGRGAAAWWFHSRMGAWDSTYWAPKRFHDFHVDAIRAANARVKEFREIQMGWWRPCTGTDEYAAHAEDDMEYFAGKNAALDAPMSVAGVNPSPRQAGWLAPTTFEVLGELTILGWYERFRRARAFQPWLLEHLSVPRCEARLRQDDDGVWRAAKLQTRSHRVSGPETAQWAVGLDAPPVGTVVRIEALGTCAATNVLTGLAVADAPAMAISAAPTVRIEKPRLEHDPVRGAIAVISATNGAATARGAWASARHAFRPYLQIGARRAITCWVRGDGSGALVNFQVETPREYGLAYSEHYVRLDFTGWRLVEMPFSETDVESYADFVWPYASGYAPVFHRTINASAVSALSVHLNEIPHGRKVEVAFTEVRFAAKERLRLNGLSLKFDHVRHAVPFALETGEIAEYADGTWTHFDRDRTPLGRVPAPSLPMLRAGTNVCILAAERIDGGAAVRAEVTFLTTGAKQPALVDFASLPAQGRALLNREPMLPVLYAPQKGFKDFPPIVIRPGEAAELAFTVRGPIGPYILSVGGTAFRFPAVPAGESYTSPHGMFPRLKGSVPVCLLTSDETPHAFFLFTKHY